MHIEVFQTFLTKICFVFYRFQFQSSPSFLSAFLPFIGRVARHTPSSRPKTASKTKATLKFTKVQTTSLAGTKVAKKGKTFPFIWKKVYLCLRFLMQNTHETTKVKTLSLRRHCGRNCHCRACLPLFPLRVLAERRCRICLHRQRRHARLRVCQA